MSLPSDLTGFQVACERCGQVVLFEDASLIAVQQEQQGDAAKVVDLHARTFTAAELMAELEHRDEEEELRVRTTGDRWMVACSNCSTEWVYWIDLRDLFDGGHTISWIGHIAEKAWFLPASFVAAVMRLAEDLYGRNAVRLNGRGKKPAPPPRERKRSALSLSVRFAVLQRDRFRCVYCGAVGVELHVDHRVSVADGGTDDPSNLATACIPCNLGKGRRSVRIPADEKKGNGGAAP